ncbi:Kinesin light chain 3 [Hondaea fermentalgiana]|uniref:Kinesin light chain 3 n=1 Tax=Hondaea fermentalgiana TaxID=2315210 RepID=A0A2R5GUG1_9STRA|nr:Kinesin light chain 3 [Hondaea fermentalgiana]|eukprot:GBG34506.1 Kinesin light chain 3 [Hondaea fermentalgiana]
MQDRVPWRTSTPRGSVLRLRLEEEDVEKDSPGTFVSQARKCRFHDLVAALEDHFGQDADAAFVWLDLFCATQPLLTSADKDLPPKVVSARNHAVIFSDRWDVPAPLQRAWCVWKVMGAITQAQSFQVAFAPGQKQAFVQALLEDRCRFARKVGDRHPDVTQALNNIAGVYDSQGRYEEALAYYEEALSIRKESLGDRHPDMAQRLNNIRRIRNLMQ